MKHFRAVVILLSCIIPGAILSDGSSSFRYSLDNSEIKPAEQAVPEHEALACTNCHLFLASADPNEQFAENPGRGCVDCHSSQKVSLDGPGSVFHSGRDGSCADCHSFHDIGILKAGETRFSFTGTEKTRYLCRSCHNSTGSLERVAAGHWLARDYYHQNSSIFQKISPSATCQHCHLEHIEEYGVISGKGGVQRAIHINPQASHPIGVGPVRTELDESKILNMNSLGLLDGKIECQTCHLLSAGNKSSLSPFKNQYDLCWICHSEGRGRALR